MSVTARAQRHLRCVALGLGLLQAAACRSDPCCECLEGKTRCNGVCVDVATDVASCGACGTTCNANAGFVCSDAQGVCTGDTTQCDGKCVNTFTDHDNCGSCGRACKPGEYLPPR